jgi:hypothetical protein
MVQQPAAVGHVVGPSSDCVMDACFREENQFHTLWLAHHAE